MSYYSEKKVMQAIRDAEATYGWDIEYRLVDQQEVGGTGVAYEYRLEIDGQYAEDEAERYFVRYGTFDEVYTEYTDYSFAEIVVVCVEL